MEISVFSKPAETKINYTDINWERTDIPMYMVLWVSNFVYYCQLELQSIHDASCFKVWTITHIVVSEKCLVYVQ